MKKISDIKKGLFKRNASLMKYAYKTGLSIMKHRNDPKKIIENIIGKDPQDFVDDLSHFKGALTKAGQLLSQYGEYYLGPRINEKLRLLQGSTHYLDFDLIKDQLNDNIFTHFDIDKSPLAAASIGQVHLARNKNTNQQYVFKIQYHGIDKAIKADLVFLKMLVSGLKIVPQGVDTSDLFDEIESVLKKEMDYLREAKVITKYKELLSDDFYYIPTILPEYSNKKSICMEYLNGVHLNQLDLESVGSEKINRIGEKVFDLFLKEIFALSYVQTDAHGGNYLVDESYDKLYLLDFGACLQFDSDVLDFYQNFLKYSFYRDRAGFFKELNTFITYSQKELVYDEDELWRYILLLSEPMRSERFDWGKTTLPDELFKEGKRLQQTLKFKSIPSHFIFLDRKIMGVFTLMRSLKAQFNVKAVFEKYLDL